MKTANYVNRNKTGGFFFSEKPLTRWKEKADGTRDVDENGHCPKVPADCADISDLGIEISINNMPIISNRELDCVIRNPKTNSLTDNEGRELPEKVRIACERYEAKFGSVLADPDYLRPNQK